MTDNEPGDLKQSPNTTGAQTADPQGVQLPPGPTYRIEALQNLSGELVITDKSSPSAWLKTDPTNAVDLGVCP